LRCQNGNENDHAVVSVLDQGSGVPQAALANIFHPFYRVADARDRQSGGSGLGLSITQRAVQIHGGSVSASNAPGGGLLVEIVLPITASEAVEV
jgi:two-component system sensor histidine kinase CpxA